MASAASNRALQLIRWLAKHCQAIETNLAKTAVLAQRIQYLGSSRVHTPTPSLFPSFLLLPPTATPYDTQWRLRKNIFLLQSANCVSARDSLAIKRKTYVLLDRIKVIGYRIQRMQMEGTYLSQQGGWPPAFVDNQEP